MNQSTSQNHQWLDKKKKVMQAFKIILFVIFFSVLIAQCLISSYLFYFGSCEQIKQFPLTMYAPSRCIR